jgi:hypothetical protein
MPKNNVSDLITDQEMVFARLIHSGTMTDRQAAEAAGLNPDSAAYIKSKPRVRAYMLEHHAAVQRQLVEQDTEERRRLTLSRDRVLARLWEIADLDPEKTRNGMSSQVKALSMIIAMEGLIPDRRSARRAVSAQNVPAPTPDHSGFYTPAWMRTQKDGDPQPPPAQEGASPETQSAPQGADDPVPSPDPPPTELSSSRPVVEGPAVPAPQDTSQTTSSLPRVPMADYVAPDTRRPFSIDKNRFGRRR